MRRLNSEIITDFVSDRGYDRANKTYFAYVPLEQMVCYVAAESYDSDTDINSAKLAVESVLAAFEEKPSFGALRKYIRRAHDQLRKNSVKNTLEAAVTVVVSDYTRIRYAVCGNVKFYLLKNNGFYIKSDEQTYFQYAAQKYGRDNIPKSENKNLLQYVGKDEPPIAFVSKKIDLPDGCTMLLTTCNIWETLYDIEIADAYESSEPGELAANIEEMYLGYQMSRAVGSYSIASMFVKKAYKEDTAKRKKRRTFLLITAIILAVLAITVTAIILITRAGDRRAMTEIEALDAEGIRYSGYGNYARSFEQYEAALKLVNALNMKNWQYIDEKRALSAEISDRWFLFRGILDGEAYLDSGNYTMAQRAFQSVESIAKNDLDLLLANFITGRIARTNAYFDIANLMLIGEMYELSDQYGNALLSYNEAADKARSLGDLALRKDIMLLLLELNKKIQENDEQQVSAVLDERERIRQEIRNEQEQTLDQYISMAAAATGNNDYRLALQLYGQVLKLYGDMGVGAQDARYKAVVDIMAELERKIVREEASEEME